MDLQEFEDARFDPSGMAKFVLPNGSTISQQIA